MSKLSKLINNPIDFFVDALDKKYFLKNKVEKKYQSDSGFYDGGVPIWFNEESAINLIKEKKYLGSKIFLYMPWIKDHGDALVSKISVGDNYSIIPFDLAFSGFDNLTRKEINKFSRENPDIYRKLVLKKLIPLKGLVSGFVFTFDWSTCMRIIVDACRELKIPTILIPHESVFADKDKYYFDITSLASLPKCDVVLCWGDLQKEIFTERGYPQERIKIVGSIKFDKYSNYKSEIDKKTFAKVYGLDPNRKIAVYAVQPLDSQFNQKEARASQNLAIRDALEACLENEFSLVVRMPPSREKILDDLTLEKIREAKDVVCIDEAEFYLTAPEETIAHCDVLLSINSTMLFEAALLGKSAFSTKYVEFDQLWQKLGIPAASNKNEVFQFFNKIKNNINIVDVDALLPAASIFGIGSFDGKAAERVRKYLSNFVGYDDVGGVNYYPDAIDRVFKKETIDVIGLPTSKESISNGSRKYLIPMLNARVYVNVHSLVKMPDIASVDLYVQWGTSFTKNKEALKQIARKTGKDILIIEDGFIRSIDIGLSGEPGMSILLDDRAAYYDAYGVSRLEYLIQNDPVDFSNINRSRDVIDKLVANRISKYNHAKDFKITIGRQGKKKILLIDQRFGDQSVASGMGSESSFEQMLMDAIIKGDEYDIFVKRHPDAIKGGQSSYFSDNFLSKYKSCLNNLFLIDFDVNPYSLFDIVDEVSVVTSGMGFEALLAGKKVNCYGVPFYSGWGLTKDIINLDRRSKKRSIEEVFYFSYIYLSRYFSPDKNSACEVEDVIDYISRVKCK